VFSSKLNRDSFKNYFSFYGSGFEVSQDGWEKQTQTVGAINYAGWRLRAFLRTNPTTGSLEKFNYGITQDSCITLCEWLRNVQGIACNSIVFIQGRYCYVSPNAGQTCSATGETNQTKCEREFNKLTETQDVLRYGVRQDCIGLGFLSVDQSGQEKVPPNKDSRASFQRMSLVPREPLYHTTAFISQLTLPVTTRPYIPTYSSTTGILQIPLPESTSLFLSPYCITIPCQPLVEKTLPPLYGLLQNYRALPPYLTPPDDLMIKYNPIQHDVTKCDGIVFTEKCVVSCGPGYEEIQGFESLSRIDWECTAVRGEQFGQFRPIKPGETEPTIAIPPPSEQNKAPQNPILDAFGIDGSANASAANQTAASYFTGYPFANCRVKFCNVKQTEPNILQEQPIIYNEQYKVLTPRISPFTNPLTMGGSAMNIFVNPDLTETVNNQQVYKFQSRLNSNCKNVPFGTTCYAQCQAGMIAKIYSRNITAVNNINNPIVQFSYSTTTALKDFPNIQAVQNFQPTPQTQLQPEAQVNADAGNYDKIFQMTCLDQLKVTNFTSLGKPDGSLSTGINTGTAPDTSQTEWVGVCEPPECARDYTVDKWIATSPNAPQPNKPVPIRERFLLNCLCF